MDMTQRVRAMRIRRVRVVWRSATRFEGSASTRMSAANQSINDGGQVRQRFLLAGALAAFLLVAVSGTPAVAAAKSGPVAVTAAASGHGWVPAPSAPWDRAAGAVCDFPVHGQSLVDKVKQLVIQTYPDGTTKLDAFKGALVVRLTNTSNGRHYDANAGGTVIVDHHVDGSVSWHAVGPVLARIAEGRSNLPRGLYILNGIYRLDISATGFITVAFVTGSADNVCSQLR